MKTANLYYGAAYYDEYMPYDRVEKDMELMEQAGMNVIRIAESTWSTWEPQEGIFDFSHLHRMLEAAKRHHISVIIGTPTYAIPSWLAKKSEDILALTHHGQNLYGCRQNMDITNPVYLEHAKIMIERLLEEVKDEPHVIGFQIDNETHTYDTCGPRVQQRFVHYLQEMYPDIETFNKEFGLDYWSNRVNCWEDFPDIRGTINESLSAEFCRFQRKLVTDFFHWQSDIIAQYKRPDQFITHNFDFEWHNYSYGLQPDTNQFAAARYVTTAGCDIYHPTQDELTGCEITICGNIARGLKRDNFFVLETQAQGNQAWLPYPGQLRLQAYSHLANGANMVEYWHWHSIHNSRESYWKGVLSHDLAPNETYRDCCRIGQEWKQIGSHLKNLTKSNKIAILVNHDSLTALTHFPTETLGAHSYNTILRRLADALFHMNIEYDIIPADKAYFPMYDCILLPALYSASEELLTALDQYVADGGNLIMTFKSAFADEHLKIYSDTQPHILHRTFGITYDQFTYPKQVSVSYRNSHGTAAEWMELITCDTASPLMYYEHKSWGRYCAAAENVYQKGHTLYLASLFDEEVLIELLSHFLYETISLQDPDKIQLPVSYPVSLKQGINDNQEHILYLLNYSDSKQSVTNTACDATELISGQPCPKGSSLTLEAWGVAILCIP